MKVGIDPGHGRDNRELGRYDPGAVRGAIFEADIALAVARFLRDECARHGWQWFLTRENSMQSAPLGMRVPRARAASCDVLVSIHCNAVERIQANGTETFYSDAQYLAAPIHRRLVEVLGTRDRGCKQDKQGLAVLKFSPAAYCELAFLSNPGDRGLLIDETWQRKMAAAIADGIAEAT